MASVKRLFRNGQPIRNGVHKIHEGIINCTFFFRKIRISIINVSSVMIKAKILKIQSLLRNEALQIKKDKYIQNRGVHVNLLKPIEKKINAKDFSNHTKNNSTCLTFNFKCFSVLGADEWRKAHRASLIFQSTFLCSKYLNSDNFLKRFFRFK